MFAASEAATLIDVLEARASQDAALGKTAFTFLEDGERVSNSLTYGELQYRARSIAVYLNQWVQPGDRVLLIYPPGLDFVAAFWGCAYAGVIAVPAVPPTNARTLPRLQAIVADAQPVVALMPESVRERLRRLEDQAVLGEVRCHTTDTMEDASESWVHPDVSPEGIAFLQYTSGSTGTPKGVMVSHGNVLANVELIRTTFSIRPHDSCVSWLPSHHDMGLVGKILAPVYCGIHSVHCPPAAFLQRPYRWLKLISDYRARLSSAPNFAYELCVSKISEEQRASLDLRCFEHALNAAEPLRASTLWRFAEAFAVSGFKSEAFKPVYGMAETTLLICGKHPLRSVEAGILRVSRTALEQDLAMTTDPVRTEILCP
jgi:acyl-CoA synthetase (AMP-forming)/AMP-acid ligase II